MKTYKPDYTRLAFVKKIVDGDTIDVSASLGYRIYQEVRVRLAGINTPELKSKDFELANKAKLRLAELLPINSELKMLSHKDRKDPFGRYIVEIWTDNQTESINDLMVSEGLAVKVDY